MESESEDSGLESGVLSLKPIVVFYPDGKSVNADVGENLLELARSAGVSIDSSCGGRGACGRCKVLIKYGEVRSKTQDSRFKTQELEEGEDASVLEPGYVLACQAEVIGDVVVETGGQLAVQSTKIQTQLGADEFLITGFLGQGDVGVINDVVKDGHFLHIAEVGEDVDV